MNIDLKTDPDWFTANFRQPLIIAGPCAAESEKQVLETAEFLAETNRVQIMRAGLWKPRTRPGLFEGVGKQGLKWLSRVKSEFGLPVMTELAKPEHLDAILEAGIDIVWIGARTSVNPFIMDDLAKALSGHDIQVFVKNPIHPDKELWIGAIERLNRQGVKRIAAIHRGFFPFEPNRYRHEPCWSLAENLQDQCWQIPMICDPSHIAGDRNLVPEVVFEALQRKMRGLMLEVHPNPEQALSDPAQQMSFGLFRKLLNQITD